MASNGPVTVTPSLNNNLNINPNQLQQQQQQQSSLFVGNLDSRVYRELLSDIFSLAGKVTQCHVVYDKNTGHSSGFGFVHYEDHATAEGAMERFRGRSIFGKLMTIDWARASNNSSVDRNQHANSNSNSNSNSQNQQNHNSADNTGGTGGQSGNYCLFVGNLSSNVTDEQLVHAFSNFGSCTSAKCAKDPVTYDTQGFAFVTFRNRDDAVSAMQAMNGQLLNNRPLRVDWAKGKTGGTAGGGTNNDTNKSNDNLSKEKELMTFEAVLAQTSINNITAYISGLPQGTSEDEIREAFARFGMIRDIRIPDSAKSNTAETIYAFVRYVDHGTAAKAIFQSQNGATQVSGKTVNVHWGREVVRRHNHHNMMQGMQMQQRPAYSQFQQQQQPHQQQQNNFQHNPNLNYYQQQQFQQFHQQAQNTYAYHQQQNPQQPQQQPPQQLQQLAQQPQAQPQGSARPMYHAQGYNRGGPGPMHQPAATAQHRFRPY